MTRARVPMAAWVAGVAALGGLGVSTYLTVVHYTEPTALACPDTGVVNCTKVTTSSASMLFGQLPVALAGVLFFIAMLALTVPVAWVWRQPQLRPARLVGAAAGMAMVVYLVWVEVWDLRAICLWCTAVHVLAFVMFVAVLAASISPPDAGRSETPPEGGAESAPDRSTAAV